ncbi:AMP-binding protein [Caldisphaera lagunensis]|uniref:AMP-binding protein n=1 Tax=Caldisphaera lagunensis TaxID=200415 RepID=UPI000694BAEC|nr:AMP-binding protein [Caldisphaera lagunensis]
MGKPIRYELTLDKLFTSTLIRSPEKEIVDRDVKRYTYKEFFDRIKRLSSGLESLNLNKGARIGVIEWNTSQYLEMFFGIPLQGSILHTINLRLSPEEILYTIKYAEDEALVFRDEFLPLVEKIAPSLQFVKHWIIINETGSLPSTKLKPVYHYDDLIKLGSTNYEFKALKEDEDASIFFTSGTTGFPKPVVHSHGGMLVEGLKAGSLHLNLNEDDVFLWYSSPSWMMWNVTLFGLVKGATVVYYDGSPMIKNLTPLWEVAEKEKLTILGTSAPFIHGVMKAGLDPKSQFNLKLLKELGSTGAPRSPQGYEWVYNHVKEDIWLNSASGGTDICSGFVGGCPILPVYKGETHANGSA